MATKSARVIQLEEGIAQAVAALDETDASRIGLQEALDVARETLADAYGTGFENAVKEYLSDGEDDEDSEEEEEDETE
ncbi:MAG: hypothetical protein ACR2J3_02535 [Aridibacter sp.]